MYGVTPRESTERNLMFVALLALLPLGLATWVFVQTCTLTVAS